MKRFSTNKEIIVGQTIELDSEESKHALKVLRLEEGDTVLLSDGKGKEAKAKIETAFKSSVVLRILEITKQETARLQRVELIQAILKGPRMDWLVEKATELSVDAIHPVTSKYSVASVKTERWLRIAQSAMKQSGNAILPEISESLSLTERINTIPPSALKILLSPSASKSLGEIIRSHTDKPPIFLALGPEGGFSDEEEKDLVQRGFIPGKLAKNILRGESAAIAALAITLHTIDF